MAKVTKEEIKKIAEMTRVSIEEFNDVISYAERVVQIAQQAEIVSVKNINADRPDVMIPTDSAKILAQAPQGDDNYFVVPKFLDN